MCSQCMPTLASCADCSFMTCSSMTTLSATRASQVCCLHACRKAACLRPCLSDAQVWNDTVCTDGQRLTGIPISLAAQLHVKPTRQRSATGCWGYPPGPAPLLKARQPALVGCSCLKLLLWACVPSQIYKLPAIQACKLPAFQACPSSCGSKLSLCALQTAARATHLGLHHPPDRNGKAITDKFSTPDLDEALNAYRVACDEARAAVRRQLRQLATGLQVGAALRRPVLKHAFWCDFSHARPHMSWDRAALADALTRKSSATVMGAPPFGSSQRVTWLLLLLPGWCCPSHQPPLCPGRSLHAQRNSAAWSGLSASQLGAVPSALVAAALKLLAMACALAAATCDLCPEPLSFTQPAHAGLPAPDCGGLHLLGGGSCPGVPCERGAPTGLVPASAAGKRWVLGSCLPAGCWPAGGLLHV